MRRLRGFVPPGTVLCLFSLYSYSANAQQPESWKIALRDASGQSFELRADSGRPTLLSFYFSNCPSACPMQTAKLANAHRILSEELKGKVSFVSISIDPEKDSAAKIKEFAERMAADGKSWRWTAPERKDELDALLKQLNIPVITDPSTKNIDHKMTFVLLDGAGRVRQRYMGTMFDTERLRNDLEALVRLQEKSRGT